MRAVGELREVRWTWKSRDNDTRVGYLAMDGRISLADLTAHMRAIAPHVPPEEIELNWATVVWTRPANADELEQRRLSDERARERHEAWERETFTRLLAKFGDPGGEGRA